MDNMEKWERHLGRDLSILPDEMMWIIFTFCDYKSLFHLSSVNKTYHKAIIKRNKVFRMKYRMYFPDQFDVVNSIIKKNKLSKSKIFKYHQIFQKEVMKRKNIELICDQKKGYNLNHNQEFMITEFHDGKSRVVDLEISSTSVFCLLSDGLILEIFTDVKDGNSELFHLRQKLQSLRNEDESRRPRQLFLSKYEKYLLVEILDEGLYRFKKSSDGVKFCDEPELMDTSNFFCCSPQNDRILFYRKDHVVVDIESKPVLELKGKVKILDEEGPVTSFYISENLDKNGNLVFILQKFKLHIIDPNDVSNYETVELHRQCGEQLTWYKFPGYSIEKFRKTIPVIPSNYLHTFTFPHKHPSLFFMFRSWKIPGFDSFVLRYGKHHKFEDDVEFEAVPNNTTMKIGIWGEKGYPFGLCEVECNSSFEINKCYVSIFPKSGDSGTEKKKRPLGNTYCLAKYKFGKFFCLEKYHGLVVAILNLEIGVLETEE